MKRLFTVITLFFAGLISFTSATAQGSGAELSLTPSSQDVEVGQTFTTDLVVETGDNQTGGVGAIISFPSDRLEVVSIETKPVFPDYPLSEYDNGTGTVKISGIVQSLDQLVSGQQTVATIQWKAKRGGSAEIAFQFSPGSTTDSNVAVTTGNGDALSSVQNATVNIKGGNILLPLAGEGDGFLGSNLFLLIILILILLAAAIVYKFRQRQSMAGATSSPSDSMNTPTTPPAPPTI